MKPFVSGVSFKPALPLDQQQGLLGWVSATLADAVRVDGLVLRRTLAGEVRVFAPERIDRAGRRHRVVEVVDPRVQREWEAQVLAELRRQGVLR